MPLATDVDITPTGQRPDEDPSLAVRNNGGTAPSADPAPAGRREALDGGASPRKRERLSACPPGDVRSPR